MSVSIFELFSIGIGPSSSHTVGPMRASYRFLKEYFPAYRDQVDGVQVDLYGSLALTGKGHCTDRASILGLTGLAPENVDPDKINEIIGNIENNQKIHLFGEKEVAFDPYKHVLFHYKENLPHHANGMRISLWSEDKIICQRDYYSVGGGFILDEDEIAATDDSLDDNNIKIPYPFETAEKLLEHCDTYGLTISELMMANECAKRDKEAVESAILEIWDAMKQSIQRGLKQEGYLPGRLHVPRRAPELYKTMKQKNLMLEDLNCLNAYAMAVNEENAAGSKVVTSPTNGAAGIIPAVLYYYLTITPDVNNQDILNYLLTSAAIGVLYKKGASISAAEVGCQGEVGVACSMAAAGLCALYGGSIYQIENAAEMGMEHNLGLTCDPIEGLVQIPCIERNTMGSVKAVNCAKLALAGDGTHKMALDNVIATMMQTGRDMSHKYKETSLGGLAVNVPNC